MFITALCGAAAWTANVNISPRSVGKPGFPTSPPLMVFEKLIRYPALAVGLKPSARQGEARLRGLYRIMYSKTIRG